MRPADVSGAGHAEPSTADLRVRREALGLSRAWVAAQLGVAEQSVTRWESGARSMPGDVFTILADAEQAAERILDVIAAGLEDADPPPDGIDVVVYPTDQALWAAHPEFAPLPASWHRMVCARIRDLTEIPVRYHYGPAGPARAGRDP